MDAPVPLQQPLMNQPSFQQILFLRQQLAAQSMEVQSQMLPVEREHILICGRHQVEQIQLLPAWLQVLTALLSLMQMDVQPLQLQIFPISVDQRSMHLQLLM